MGEIERVARAMAQSTNGGDFHDERWYSEDHRKLWRQRARVAIETLRRPSYPMQVVGKDKSWISVDGSSSEGGPRSWRLEFEQIGEIWEAMIDAALKDDGDESQ